jgi:phosphoribosylglycinamide formyltransferase-1
MSTRPLPVAVLVSGRGSNMEAIAHAGLEDRIPARVVAVISDRPDAAGLETARSLGIRTEILQVRPGQDRTAYGAALASLLASHAPALVVLAGFMRILDAGLVRAWEGRMLNIHPSLLPRYPGLHTHRRVLDAGDPLHGCTVHFVTEQLDAGPRIVQARVPVEPGDDERSLSARVQRWEHIIYPEAVGWFGEGRLAARDGFAWLDGRRLDEPVARGEA